MNEQLTTKSIEHLTKLEDLTPEQIERLCVRADDIVHQLACGDLPESLRGKIICLLFFEPDPNGYMSFQSAIARLGGRFILGGGESSSLAKGESLHDTLKVVSGFWIDLIVLKQSQMGINEIVNASSVPVINAGDNSISNPVRELIGLYEIKSKIVKSAKDADLPMRMALLEHFMLCPPRFGLC